MVMENQEMVIEKYFVKSVGTCSGPKVKLPTNTAQTVVPQLSTEDPLSVTIVVT